MVLLRHARNNALGDAGKSKSVSRNLLYHRRRAALSREDVNGSERLNVSLEDMIFRMFHN